MAPSLKSWSLLKTRGGSRQAPSYSRPPGSPFTYPAFEASEEQLQNMQSLSEILREWVAASRQGYTMELAELYREQARFDESLQVIQTLDEQEVGGDQQPHHEAD
jgi:hypothetical protein